MSNQNQTKKHSKSRGKRKPIPRKVVRKLPAYLIAEHSLGHDDETLSVMAAFEWLGFEKQMREQLGTIGITDQTAYLDVRLGMRHRSADAFINWAKEVGIAYARNHDELETRFDALIQALSVAVRFQKYTTGIDHVAKARAATRNMKVSNTIRSHELPSGAKYFYAPYEFATSEYIVWLLKYSRKFERPWRGNPFG